MLVVLAIIAVAAGATALGIGAVTRAPSVESEARRLGERLQAAGDDAMLGDRMVAFTVDPHGYGFAAYRDGVPVARKDAGFAYHQLPGGMVMTIDLKPPIVLGIDGNGMLLNATVESGSQRWRVTYDGMNAEVAPMKPGEKLPGQV
ncbi:MAG: type II secretion system protein GspH [Sphingomonas sp.]|nr:type II secretion system protein GspH [Sphingomonas sp.]